MIFALIGSTPRGPVGDGQVRRSAVAPTKQRPEPPEVLGLPGEGAVELGAGAGVVEGDEPASVPRDEVADVGGEGRPVRFDQREGAQRDGAEGDQVGRLEEIQRCCQEA
ncbi:MAG: hypothetical protein K0S78_1271 [Thermomicrobiales bacterium]|jgi:hypothetical protein|nr:hypothetical protein [Thermomicrobiales bacterium]MDF3037807.1 hypothetical protein [Thermomicrobiales bacterium]